MNLTFAENSATIVAAPGYRDLLVTPAISVPSHLSRILLIGTCQVDQAGLGSDNFDLQLFRGASSTGLFLNDNYVPVAPNGKCCGIVQWVDTPGAGLIQYTLAGNVAGATANSNLFNMVLTALLIP